MTVSVRRLDAIRERDKGDWSFEQEGSVYAPHEDRRWLLTRVEALSAALRDVLIEAELCNDHNRARVAEAKKALEALNEVAP